MFQVSNQSTVQQPSARSWTVWIGTSRLLLAVLVAVSAFARPSEASESNKPSRPNILLILADDLGFSDLGCYGSEIQTPNLDSLAENGLRYTQFYNTARCWPTRASLMTGYYPQQVRRDFLPNIPSGGRGTRPTWAPLLPKLLRSQGYRSYHTGKWHIDGMPVEEGFNHSYYLKDQGRFFNPKKHWKDDKALPPVEKGTDFYATTALADHAIEVLQDHHRNHTEAPFFHYLAFAAPHFPLHALPEDIAVYKDTYRQGWNSIRAQRWKRQHELGLWANSGVRQLSRPETDLGPPYHFPQAFEILGAGEVNKPVPWNSLSNVQQEFQANKMAIHAAMIHRMDIEIGRVFDQIRSMDRWDDTLVIFLSDNGASAEIMVRDDGHDPAASPGSAATYLCLGPGWSTTCNTPFRRHKTWTHEGGTSTPLVMSWPNGIKARGEIRTTRGHVIDIVATLLDLTEAKRAPDSPEPPGQSLQESFSSNTAGRDTIWWYHDRNKAIRSGDWKAVAPVAEPWELYNLAADRDESTDLAIPRKDKLDELVAEWNITTASFQELASRDLPPDAAEKAKQRPAQSAVMNAAQRAAKPKRRQVLLNGKSFLLNDRHAFTMLPDKQVADNKPWIFYGPTLNPYPDKAESWMHQQFLNAGIAIAGVDVGEAYGSPHAFPHFEALYQHMVDTGYSKKPILLGRSRGGLWVSSWAIAHPDRVTAIAGIYPVYDYTTYPGVERAATAYGVTAEQLQERQDDLNPIRRASVLAMEKIPVFIIHGTDDKVVPIAQNSNALQKIYDNHNAGDVIEILKAEGQGHSFWEGFFHCQELVDFVVKHSRHE